MIRLPTECFIIVCYATIVEISIINMFNECIFWVKICINDSEKNGAINHRTHNMRCIDGVRSSFLFSISLSLFISLFISSAQSLFALRTQFVCCLENFYPYYVIECMMKCHNGNELRRKAIQMILIVNRTKPNHFPSDEPNSQMGKRIRKILFAIELHAKCDVNFF